MYLSNPALENENGKLLCSKIKVNFNFIQNFNVYEKCEIIQLFSDKGNKLVGKQRTWKLQGNTGNKTQCLSEEWVLGLAMPPRRYVTRFNHSDCFPRENRKTISTVLGQEKTKNLF